MHQAHHERMYEYPLPARGVDGMVGAVPLLPAVERRESEDGPALRVAHATCEDDHTHRPAHSGHGVADAVPLLSAVVRRGFEDGPAPGNVEAGREEDHGTMTRIGQPTQAGSALRYSPSQSDRTPSPIGTGLSTTPCGRECGREVGLYQRSSIPHEGVGTGPMTPALAVSAREAAPIAEGHEAENGPIITCCIDGCGQTGGLVALIANEHGVAFDTISPTAREREAMMNDGPMMGRDVMVVDEPDERHEMMRCDAPEGEECEAMRAVIPIARGHGVDSPPPTAPDAAAARGLALMADEHGVWDPEPAARGRRREMVPPTAIGCPAGALPLARFGVEQALHYSAAAGDARARSDWTDRQPPPPTRDGPITDNSRRRACGRSANPQESAPNERIHDKHGDGDCCDYLIDEMRRNVCARTEEGDTDRRDRLNGTQSAMCARAPKRVTLIVVIV